MMTSRIVQNESTHLDTIKSIKQNPMGEQKTEFGMPGRKQETLPTKGKLSWL